MLFSSSCIRRCWSPYRRELQASKRLELEKPFVKENLYYRKSCSLRSTPQSKDAASLDVSGTVVNPSFRSTPWYLEPSKAADAGGAARVLFVSESGVCRAVLALAFFNDLLKQQGLDGAVVAEARSSRDYNVGDAPEASVVDVLNRVGLQPPLEYAARLFDDLADIINFDLVLVMDKFTAADVLREVSVYDTINKATQYSLKVRRLGSFHPQLADRDDPEGQDLQDALYGNIGGEAEEAAVASVAGLIQESCQGLVQHLQQLQQSGATEGLSLRQSVEGWVKRTEAMDWMVPPLLQRKERLD